MTPRLWALVSLAVAREIGSSYCSLAFAGRLLRMGFTPADLLLIVSDSQYEALSDGERVAMDVAAKVARNASQVSQHDIDRLRAAGFTDAGIFDVVAAAAWRCFFARVPDALGAAPDRALGQLSAALLQHLVVGRAIDTESD
jgi:alkylhydroperoxidase family enzyme